MGDLKVSFVSVVRAIQDEIPSDKISQFAAHLEVSEEYNHIRNNPEYSQFDKVSRILDSFNKKSGRKATMGSLISVLRKMCCCSAAEKLEELGTGLNEYTGAETSEKIYFDCLPQYLDQRFCGRVQELALLESLFQTPRRLALVSGLGGVGKSSFVRMFAKKNRCQYHCLILRAGDSSSLRNDIFTLAQEHGVHINIKTWLLCFPLKGLKTKAPSQVIDECIQKIRSQTSAKFLLVFDNVTSSTSKHLATTIISYLRKYEEVYSCITARENDLFNEFGMVHICLTALDDASAINLLSTELKGETPADLKRLCHKLNYFPFGLVQAVTYIRRQQKFSTLGKHYKIKDFIEEMEKNPQGYLEEKYDTDDMRTLLTIWDIHFKNFKQLKNLKTTQNREACMKILNTLSFVNPDGIKLNLLLSLAFGSGQVSWTNVTREWMEFLKNIGFVTVENNVACIHRLVQQVIRIKISNLVCTIQEISRNALSQLQQSTPDATILVHIMSIWKNISVAFFLEVPYEEIAKLICCWMLRLGENEKREEFKKKVEDFLKIRNTVDTSVVVDIGNYLQELTFAH